MYTEDLTWRNGRILLGPNIDWWYITEKNQDELKYQGRPAHCFFINDRFFMTYIDWWPISQNIGK